MNDDQNLNPVANDSGTNPPGSAPTPPTPQEPPVGSGAGSSSNISASPTTPPPVGGLSDPAPPPPNQPLPDTPKTPTTDAATPPSSETNSTSPANDPPLTPPPGNTPSPANTPEENPPPQEPPDNGNPPAGGEEDEPSTPVGPEDVEKNSPVIPTALKKSKTGLIAGISAILLLLVSVPIGIILVKNQQDIREKAFGGFPAGHPARDCIPNTSKCWDTNSNSCLTVGTSPTSCGGDNLAIDTKIERGSKGLCSVTSISRQCPANTRCIKTGQCLDESAIAQSTRSGLNESCSAQSDCQDNLTCKDGTCKWNSGIGLCCGIDSQCPSGSCSESNNDCESGLSCSLSEPTAPETTPAPDSTPSSSKTPTSSSGSQTAGGPDACTVKAEDGQTLATQSVDVKAKMATLHPDNMCQEWANQHNREIKSIMVYAYPYDEENKVDNPGKDTLKAGDSIKLCVLRPDRTKYSRLKLIINNGIPKYSSAPESDGKKFCVQTELPSTTTIRVTGQWEP